MASGIFSMEVVQADQGDCLILHYGPSRSKVSLALIDGGPKGIYKNFLRPRLLDLSDGDALSLDLLMVSHVDDDHIRGVIEFFKDIDEGINAQIDDFWFNSFDSTTKKVPAELTSINPLVSSDTLSQTALSDAVLQSIGQGRELRTLANQMGLAINSDDSALIIAEDYADYETSGGLTLDVVGPSKARLLKLYQDWKKKSDANPASIEAITAEYADKSVYNLSSIVVVAKYKNKTMLLTGDARGDDVLEGLKLKGLLDGADKAHFDLLKVPHHGSSRNVEPEFFESITASKYVISANGMHDNPDSETLQWIYMARGDEDYEVILTNSESAKFPALKRNISQAIKKFPKLKQKLRIRPADQLSIRVDLLG